MATAMAPSPAPTAVDEVPSPSSSEVEIVESATISSPRAIRRPRPVTASRLSVVSKPCPPAKLSIKGKGKRKEKTPEASTASFAPVSEPARIMSSVLPDLFDEALPTVDSPPGPVSLPSMRL